MLHLTIHPSEMTRENPDGSIEFITVNHEYDLQLEHSLVSLGRWESKWKKPFLKDADKLTREEMLDYVRCMTMTKGVPDEAYYGLTPEDLIKIRDYIADSHTATTIYDFRPNVPQRQETITSELIYCWMIQCGIPHEFDKWHLNRLLTLIRLCNIKQTPQQNMTNNSIYAQNKMLNDMRRAAMHTKG